MVLICPVSKSIILNQGERIKIIEMDSQGILIPMLATLAGASTLAATAVLLKPILSPTIITYPWKREDKKSERTVVLAGSYNPPHLGHLAMLEYLSKR